MSVLTKIVDGERVVQWTWRKKSFSKRGDGIKMRLSSPSYYKLDEGEFGITIAWRAPRELDEQGREMYPDSVYPCSREEEEKLEGMFKRRNPSLYAEEEYEARQKAARSQREKKVGDDLKMQEDILNLF